MTKCPYCKRGHTPNEKGEHWIVNSIYPAEIDIRRCKNWKPGYNPYSPGHEEAQPEWPDED